MATSARAPLPAARLSAYQRGAYAVILNNGGQVLVVESNGRFYLPGGRIEQGEEPREALSREIVEECGWAAELAEEICQQTQMILAGRVVLAAGYWRARLTVPLSTLPEHDVLWLDISDAMTRLHRASDRAALSLATQ